MKLASSNQFKSFSATVPTISRANEPEIFFRRPTFEAKTWKLSDVLFAVYLIASFLW